MLLCSEFKFVLTLSLGDIQSNCQCDTTEKKMKKSLIKNEMIEKKIN